MSETTRTVRTHRVGLTGRLLSDQNLASRISGGDSAACDELFRRYHQPIYRFCSAMVGPEEAKDVLQNVMTKAMTSIPDNEDFQMKPWLYRVARNECIDHMRQGQRTTTGLDPDTRPDESGMGDPHRAAVDRERLNQLVDDLNDLPENQRSTLVMRELSGLRYAEIAASLGTTEAGAKQLVYEARLSLEQAELGRRLDCAEVRESISSRDRRRLKGRKVRSHMRSCRDCANFERSISERQAGFQSLFPVLPLGASMGILDAIQSGGSAAVSGGGAVGAASGGVLAGGVASGVIAKGTVALLVAGGIGVGTAEIVRHQDGKQTSVHSVAGRAGAGGQASSSDGSADRVPVLPIKGGPESDSSNRRSDRGLKTKGTRVAKTDNPAVPGTGGAGARITPGRGKGQGPASLPEASNRGQARADEASNTVPGQTGAPPPSKKPASPPGQTNSGGGNVPNGAANGASNTSQGKSAEAPAVGRPESPGKSGK